MAAVGYIRVSSVDQALSRQLDGIQLDKSFEDRLSGGTTKRPGLSACLEYLRDGDVLHVHSIDRLARNLGDLQSLVSALTGRGVSVLFHQENLLFDDTTSPMQTLLFQVMGAFAQFERALIKERQREGIAQAKAKGKHLGRPTKLSENDKQRIQESFQQGVSPVQLAEQYGVSVSSIHKLRIQMRCS